MDAQTTIDSAADYLPLLRVLGDRPAMLRHPRRHVLTYADTQAVGEPPSAALPASVPADGWHAFRLPVGPRPQSGRAWAALAFDPAGAGGDSADVRVNGEPCAPAEPVSLDQPSPPEPAWRYPVDLDALRDGHAVVEVHARAPLTVTWVEIAILPSEG